jgi:TonB family protein
VRSALENFIPEVKPGNQTALNTRAAPFAQFITRMHRQIHELWAFGFMAGLDSKPSTIPLNNPSLVAKLEIVLDQQGHVDRVNMVRSSGLTVYDAAAIDVVYSASPYPPPPPAILSGNGKVYIHWTFHRNEEACGTMGVDYFILNNGPKAKETATPPS